jgi:hypothetical protein
MNYFIIIVFPTPEGPSTIIFDFSIVTGVKSSKGAEPIRVSLGNS